MSANVTPVIRSHECAERGEAKSARRFGRRAGSVADFAYSPAVKASGITWNDTTLFDYLRDPQAFVPGIAWRSRG